MPTDQNRNGELPDSDLDTVLAAASSELLAHVRAHAGPAAALLAIMAASEPRSPAGPGPQNPVPLPPLGWPGTACSLLSG
jgi:hypothetical protein